MAQLELHLKYLDYIVMIFFKYAVDFNRQCIALGFYNYHLT